MEIYERKNRLAEALNIRNMKQVELCEKTGLSKAQINNWVKQRWQPKQTPLFKMAKALDVSEMWLAGYDVPMERSVSQKNIEAFNQTVQTLRENERYYHLVEYLIRLKPETIDAVEAMLKQLK